MLGTVAYRPNCAAFDVNVNNVNVDNIVSRSLRSSSSVTNRPPRGLGSSVAKFKQILGACENAEEALLEFDRAIRGEHGGAREGAGRKPSNADAPHDPETGEIKADNVSLELTSDRKRSSDYGNAAQAGLRRLEKAAEGGDGNAAEMLRRVLDPSDGMTVHGACVELGWRKPSHADVSHGVVSNG